MVFHPPSHLFHYLKVFISWPHWDVLEADRGVKSIHIHYSKRSMYTIPAKTYFGRSKVKSDKICIPPL